MFRPFYSSCLGIRSYWVPNQDFIADDPSIQLFSGLEIDCFMRCVSAHIVMVMNNPTSLVCYSNFTEDFWQKNGYVPFRYNYPKFS